MRSILEKAIVHLLNQESDQAQALFHKFMVERARQIHESLRNSEDAILTEGWDENITSESYYTGDDLEGLEDGNDSDADLGGDMGGDDFGGESDPSMDGSDDASDDFGADDVDGDAGLDGDDFGGEDFGAEGDDLGSESEGVESDLEEIKDKLADLTAQFEKFLGGDESADMSGDEFGDDSTEDFGSDTGSEMDTDAVEDDMSDDVGSEADMGADADTDFDSEDKDEKHFGESEENDDFDDITESIVAELEKVNVTMADGKEVAGGKSFSQNNTSVGLQKKPNPMTDGKPVQVKASEHKGFERETAPSVKDMKKRRNTKSKAEDGRSSVSKEGDKGAILNKDFGKGGEANTKSPLAKR